MRFWLQQQGLVLRGLYGKTARKTNLLLEALLKKGGGEKKQQQLWYYGATS